MTAPTITTLPPAPTRADAPDDYTAKADARVAAEGTMVTEINEVVAWMSGLAIDAEVVEELSNRATQAVSDAQAYAANAAASAAAAEDAGSGNNLAFLQATALLF